MIPCSGEEYYYKIDNLLLSSCQQIRGLVRNRWRKDTGKEWIDGEEQGTDFIRICDQIYKKSMKIQKGMIAKGCLEDWDLSLLSNVLQNFGNADDNKNENEAVRALIQVRNELAHHPNKKLTTEDYNSKVAILRSTLIAIGLTESDIEKAIEKAGITSSVQALESVKKLYEKAEILEKEGKFAAAVECYTEAIATPSLLPINQGVAYENRAYSYLKLLGERRCEEDSESMRKQALLDAKQALELNAHSWKAHYLVAQCHRLDNKLADAILHYQRALAISPVQKQVKNDFEVCKILTNSQVNPHSSPSPFPMNFSEKLADLENETGIKVTKEEFRQRELFAGVMIVGQDHVYRGHRFTYGWEVKQDHSEAARHYSKAAQVGNPEGMYFLGLSYSRGRGVVQDPSKAFEYFLKAANMSADSPGESTPLRKNAGVAHAQHALGVMYSHGVHVEQNYIKSAIWYSKALDNGVGASACTLGCLHFEGNGVLRNEKMAEMYWNTGVAYRDPQSAAALMQYYISHLEPEKATIFFNTGKELGHPGLLNMKEEEWNGMLLPAKLKREEKESEILTFEKEHNLDIKGFTFLERGKRWASLQGVLEKDCLRFFENLKSVKCAGAIHQQRLADPNVVKCIAERAVRGSITATELVEFLQCKIEVVRLLTNESCLTEERKEKIMGLIYKCATLQTVFFSMEHMHRIQMIIRELFTTKCEEEGELDMKIRYAFVSFNLQGSIRSKDTFCLELLKEGIRRYPRNPHYYELLSDLLFAKDDIRSALDNVDEGLKEFPENAKLLFNKAICLVRLSEGELPPVGNGEVISALEEFLKKAPSDHKRVPQAYYMLGWEYLPKVNDKDGNAIFVEDEEGKQKLEHYYKKGLNSEKDQLPCYLPYEYSQEKDFLKLELAQLNSKPNSTQASPAVQKQQTLSILERKPYLNDPLRRVLLIEHRTDLAFKNKIIYSSQSFKPVVGQTCAKKMSRLKSLTLKEMRPMLDKVYEDCMIDLTIIEDACFDTTSIHLLAEDDEGDVTRLYLYNMGANWDDLQENFGFGNRIAIINPYVRIAGFASANGIRNFEPKCLVLMEKVVNMCRFCGEEGAPRKCSKCERSYCSRECQRLDWKMFQHKLVCITKQ